MPYLTLTLLEKKGPTLMPSMTQRQWLQFSFGVDYCRVGCSVEHVGLTPPLRPVILCSGRNRHPPYLAFREVSVLLAGLACCLLGGPIFVGFISFSLLFSFLVFFFFFRSRVLEPACLVTTD